MENAATPSNCSFWPKTTPVQLLQPSPVPRDVGYLIRLGNISPSGNVSIDPSTRLIHYIRTKNIAIHQSNIKLASKYISTLHTHQAGKDTDAQPPQETA